MLRNLISRVNNYYKLCLAEETLDLSDEAKKQYYLFLEDLSNITEIFTIKLNGELRRRLLNSKFIGKQFKDLPVKELNIEIRLDELEDKFKNKVPDIFVNFYFINREFNFLDSGGHNNLTDNLIEIDTYISDKNYLNDETVRYIYLQCTKTFRHELQHYFQDLSKLLTNGKYYDVENETVLEIYNYYLQNIEVDAFISSLVEKELRVDINKLKKDPNYNINIVNITPLIEKLMQKIKKELNSASDRQQYSNQFIDTLIQNLYNTYIDWLYKNFPVKKI